VIDGTTGEAASHRTASGTAPRQPATHQAERIDGTGPGSRPRPRAYQPAGVIDGTTGEAASHRTASGTAPRQPATH
jgi:hypothetical protein